MTEARKDRRAPASIKVKYKSANMTEFVELVGGDVSRGGIFVKTKKPLEPGALLKFEFQLQGGEPMIYGVGRVAWRRTEEGARPTLPAGMGIKFIKLNGLSRSVIDRIEAKHGPGSRFDQTDGAELATSISSAPPSGFSQAPGDNTVPPSATLITPLRPEAMRAAAEADLLAAPRSGKPLGAREPGAQESGRSSPPLREARVSGPRPSMLPVTFRPPPPAAAGSVPPPHAASSNPPRPASVRPGSSGAFGQVASHPAAAVAAHGGASAVSGTYAQSGSPTAALGGGSAASGPAPRGALGASVGASQRRPVSTRSAARDASEFLASTFSVGGAGREVRSEAHAQAERARHDPRSVDLANELFGDLNAGGAKPEADATLDADPMLGNLQTAATTPAPATPTPIALEPELAARTSARAVAATARLRTTPKPTAANNQLALKLGSIANETTLRPRAKAGRGVWIAVFAAVGVAIGAGAFYLQRASSSVVEGAPPPTAAAVPEQPSVPAPVVAAPAAVVTVDLPVSSQPAGAAVSVDGVAVGTTPVTLKLSQGKTVQLSLHSPGFATKVDSVNVAADTPARSVTLEPLAFELVVTEPTGATVKVLDKSVEAPAPLDLGVLFAAGSAQEVTLTVEKAGFQRFTRRLTRADFQEEATAMRAELSIPLVAAGPAAKAAAVAKAAAPKAPATIAAKTAVPAPPPEPGAPPEPEAAAENPPPAAEKPKAEAAPSAPPPSAETPAPAPAPPPTAPPSASDIPADP